MCALPSALMRIFRIYIDLYEHEHSLYCSDYRQTFMFKRALSEDINRQSEIRDVWVWCWGGASERMLDGLVFQTVHLYLCLYSGADTLHLHDLSFNILALSDLVDIISFVTPYPIIAPTITSLG
jgi:hypothetical protein